MIFLMMSVVNFQFKKVIFRFYVSVLTSDHPVVEVRLKRLLIYVESGEKKLSIFSFF